ncbi:MAG: DUF167 domain-containing protein [Candidatus Omnitrophota bacterium]
MKFNVKVKANSKVEQIEKLSGNEYSVKVKSPAQEGRANQALINLLSKYFDIPKSKVIIIKGHKNKNKTIEILEE